LTGTRQPTDLSFWTDIETRKGRDKGVQQEEWMEEERRRRTRTKKEESNKKYGEAGEEEERYMHQWVTCSRVIGAEFPLLFLRFPFCSHDQYSIDPVLVQYGSQK
jgi:hypothetical protein